MLMKMIVEDGHYDFQSNVSAVGGGNVMSVYVCRRDDISACDT